ncbi:ThuA domain-containing protein [Puteibacter caeruleilacunae]|nr:ThuA domain-containing protein [Puteibacter caeruleilacunae]
MKKILVLLLAMVISAGSVVVAKEKKEPVLKVLVFTKTDGFRHKSSIEEGVKTLIQIATEKNWLITITEDASFFTDDILSKFDMTVWLNSTGNVLNEKQQKAFMRFIKKGKGFVGIHGASDCEKEWDWYRGLCGAWFKTHPPFQTATINIEDTNHPAMAPFVGMKTFTTDDEWYVFRSNPRARVNVLASLDESSVKKGKDGWQMGDHPVIWYQEYEGARSFYTVFCHGANAYENEKIVQHLTGAIEWAGKLVD